MGKKWRKCLGGGVRACIKAQTLQGIGIEKIKDLPTFIVHTNSNIYDLKSSLTNQKVSL